MTLATPAPPDVPPPYDCRHERKEPRLRTLSNGATQVWVQCLSCGRGVGSQRKRDFTPQQLAALTPYDPDLEGGTWEGYRAQRQRAAAEEREREVAQWWAAYDAYLRSPEWRRRRRDTLARDGYRCQAALPGCDGRATQVHHLSYRHRGNEPLFDLTSVCDGCHAALHAAEATAPEGGLR